MLEDERRVTLIKLIGDAIITFNKTVEGGASVPRMLLISQMFEAHYQGKDLSINEATNQCAVSPRSMKRVIDQLESVGLIHMYKCDYDGRVKKLRLDAEFVYNMRQVFEPLWQRTVQNLSE